MLHVIFVLLLFLICAVPVNSETATFCQDDSEEDTENKSLNFTCPTNKIIQIQYALVYYDEGCRFYRSTGVCTREQDTVLELCHGNRTCTLDSSLSVVDLPGCFHSTSNVFYITYWCATVNPKLAVTLPLDVPFEYHQLFIFNRGYDLGIPLGPKSYTCRIRPASALASTKNITVNINIYLVRFEATNNDCDESLELKTGTWERKFCSQRKSRFYAWNQQEVGLLLQEELTITHSRIQDTPGKRFWMRIDGFQPEIPEDGEDPPRPGATDRAALTLTCTEGVSPNTDTDVNSGTGPKSKADKEVNLGAIVGGLAAVVVLLIIILVAVAVVICIRRRKSVPPAASVAPDVVSPSQNASARYIESGPGRNSDIYDDVEPVNERYANVEIPDEPQGIDNKGTTENGVAAAKYEYLRK